MISEICFDEILVVSSKTVFETMIFMDITESCDPAMKNDDPESIMGSISFKGSIEGCLSIFCSKKCSQLIALNMLGMDEDEQISEEEIQDAIGEVANMVMGSVKGALDDSPVKIEVSIPIVVKGSGLEQCVHDSSNNVLFEACLEESYPLSIRLEYRAASGQNNN